MFEANRPLNFDITLSPEAVATYLTEKVLFARLNSVKPEELEAALFVTVDGECGFVASNASKTTYKFLTNEFRDFVLKLPEGLSTKLWSRVQKNNHKVHRLLDRLGFVKDQESDTAYYYIYKGG